MPQKRTPPSSGIAADNRSALPSGPGRRTKKQVDESAEMKLAELANLGPKSAQALVSAGIRSLVEVQQLGAVACYAKVKRNDPRVTLNLLWALEGALSGLPWQVVAKEHRTSLLLALDELQNGV